MHGTPLEDVVYAEFNSTGPGASPQTRVKWSMQLNLTQANNWTAARVLQGWVPQAEATYPSEVVRVGLRDVECVGGTWSPALQV